MTEFKVTRGSLLAMAAKELLGVPRRIGTMLARAFALGVLLLILINALMRAHYFDYSMYARLGRDLFESVGAALAILLPLSAATYAADLIAGEVRRKTLGILSLTSLTPMRIVAGKFLAAMAHSTAMLVLAAPFLATCVVLGGILSEQLAAVLVLLLALCALASAISILVSTFIRRAHIAILVSIVALVVHLYVRPIIFTLLLGRISQRPDFWIYTNPGFTIPYALEGELWIFGGGLETAWIVSSEVSFVWTAAFLVWAALRTRRLAYREQGEVPAPAEQPYHPAAIAQSTSAHVWESLPLVWKETRHVLARWRRRPVRSIVPFLILPAFVLCCLPYMRRERISNFLPAASLITMHTLFLAALAHGTGAFTHEKEIGAWDALLAAPLSGWSLVKAKLAAAALGCFWPWLVTTAVFALNQITSDYALPVYAVGIVNSLFLLVLGVGSSAVFRDTRKAFTAAIFVPIVLWVLTPLLLTMAGLRWSQFEAILKCTNPEPFFEYLDNPGPFPESWDASWWWRLEWAWSDDPYFLYHFMTLTCVSVALHAALGRGFDRIVRRPV
jgi:ABC-type transport system involved in multi-copper enzyme maturation permease subunit